MGLLKLISTSASCRGGTENLTGPARGRASPQGQAAARFVERRGDDFFGGGRSKSAGTRKRARRRCTIAMLSPILPRNTSLTRLGVPGAGLVRSRETVLVHQVADQIGGARRPTGPFISSYAATRRACASSRATSAGSFEFHNWSTSARARKSSASLSIRMRVASSYALRIDLLSCSACPAALRLPAPVPL